MDRHARRVEAHTQPAVAPHRFGRASLQNALQIGPTIPGLIDDAAHLPAISLADIRQRYEILDDDAVERQADAEHLLAVPELVDVLDSPGRPRIDLVAFDACLMAMAEVGFSLRDLTDVFVASQEVVGAEGHDYRTLFSTLEDSPDMTSAQALATGFVASYEEQYEGSYWGWNGVEWISVKTRSTSIPSTPRTVNLESSPSTALRERH